MASSTFSQTISVKLNSTNYLLWHSHFSAYLRGHDLFGHVDGSTPCPPRDLSAGEKNSEGTVPKNQAFNDWVKQDQLILSAIYASVSEGVHSQIVRCSTARDVWLRLERSFASSSQARVMQLQLQLSRTKKGSSSIMEYLTTITSIADRLAAVSKPVPDSDLVLYALGGLGPEYGSFVTSITTRLDPISFDDLHGYLLSHEIRLTEDAAQIEVAAPAVNVSTKTEHRNPRHSEVVVVVVVSFVAAEV
ncbi:hypothetical protein BVC80_1483g3 [Macleaya cordata]|uniref:Uncharacterized protein n=1 Tax=Macleaya cordata TaxID=56857 RepID=A0A200QNM1_MACCD|nr:hypothetical protein BVC80_1483g3 [Macleaya cordata]